MKIADELLSVHPRPGDLAEFMKYRPLLFSIAYRMLGSLGDAEDMVQETFLRWQGADDQEIQSPKAFLTTILTRLCLNYRKSSHFRLEESVASPEVLIDRQNIDPASETRLADALETAFTVVLASLSPVERAVFLLREIFNCDFGEVARMVEKSEDNCRQILHRARERIGERQSRFEVSSGQQERVVHQFLSASTDGDFRALLETLAEDATLICDASNQSCPAPPPLFGPARIVQFFSENKDHWTPGASSPRIYWLWGCAILLLPPATRPAQALIFRFQASRVRAIYRLSCPERLHQLSILIDSALPSSLLKKINTGQSHQESKN